MENWKPVVGYEGRYEVSDLGNVRSLITVDSRGQKRHPGILSKNTWLKNGKPMRQFVTLMGYNNTRKTCKVHNLVMEAHVGKCPEGKMICHNNSNAIDNCLSNLRYDTQAGNMLDCIKEGRTLRGEKNKKAKLTEDQARTIKYTDIEKRGDLTALAREYNISLVTVSQIKSNRQWAWL